MLIVLRPWAQQVCYRYIVVANIRTFGLLTANYHFYSTNLLLNINSQKLSTNFQKHLLLLSIYYYICSGYGYGRVQDILGKIEALCLTCNWKPEKFSRKYEESVMALRVSRGLLSLHLFAKVFLGPPIKGVAKIQMPDVDIEKQIEFVKIAEQADKSEFNRYGITNPKIVAETLARG